LSRRQKITQFGFDKKGIGGIDKQGHETVAIGTSS